MEAGDTVSLQAGSLNSNGGLIAALGTGTGGGGAPLNLAIAGAIGAQGATIGSGGDVTVSAASVDASLGGKISAPGAVRITAASGNISAANTGELSAGSSLVLSAGNGTIDASSGGVLGSLGSATLSANALNTSGGGVLSAQSLSVTVGSITNSNGGQIKFLANSPASLSVAGAIANDGGTIAANASDLSISAGSLNNQNGLIAHGGSGTLRLTVGNRLDNSAGGRIATNGVLNLSAGTIANNNGSITAAGNAGLSSTSGADLNNTDGKILAGLNGLTPANAFLGLNLGAGGLSNSGGVVEAGNGISISGAGVTNNGTILSYGGGGLTAILSGAFDNGGGTAGSAGGVAVAAASLSNAGGGSLFSGSAGDLTLNLGSLSNGGAIQSGGSLTLNVTGGITNSGTLSALGGITIDPTDLDNRGGTITGGGQGLTISISGALDNSNGGHIGASGPVTLSANSLNNQSGTIASGSGGNLALSITGQADNSNGTLYGGNNLTLGALSIVNAGGSIAASQDVTLISGGNITNTSGTIAGYGTVTLNAGGGTIDTGSGSITGNDVSLSFTNLTGLTASVSGSGNTVGNVSGTNSLSLIASGNFDNAAGQQIVAPNNLTLSANGALSNAGTITAAGTTTLNGIGLSNTGAIFGGQVVVNAGSGNITNTGGVAVIGARNALNLNSYGDIQNLDGANLYSQGTIGIAGAGGSGSANSLLNSSATIQADGDISISAGTITNIRTVFTYIDSTDPSATVVANTPAPYYPVGQQDTTYDFIHNTGIYVGNLYHTIPQYGNDVTFYDLIYSETVTETTISGNSTSQAQIISGGSINLNAGTVTNYVSTISAAGNLSISAGTVNNTGLDINRTAVQSGDYHYGKEHASDLAHPTINTEPLVPYSNTVTTTVSSIPAILSGAGTVTINAPFINNNNLAGGGSPTSTSIGAPLQSVLQSAGSGPAVGSSSGTGGGAAVSGAAVTGGAVQTAAVNTANGGGVSSTNVSAQNASAGAVTVASNTIGGQSVASAAFSSSGVGSQGTGVVAATVAGAAFQGAATGTGLPGTDYTAGTANLLQQIFRVPPGGQFVPVNRPGSQYLVAINTAFPGNPNSISSNLYLTALGFDPTQVQQRLGDGQYEQELVQRQLVALTGAPRLAGYASNTDEYAALLMAGVQYAKQYNLGLGVSLSADQMASLTSDMVLMVSDRVQTADGPKDVLVPVVYLAPGHSTNLAANGALIAGGTINLTTTDLANAGAIKATQGATILASNDILNSGLISAGHVGVISAGNNITNIGGAITGGDLSLSAGNNITLTSLTGTTRQIDNLNTTVTQAASIQASGNLSLVAGGALTLKGASITSGGNMIASAQTIDLGTVQTGTKTGPVYNGALIDKTVNVGSTISAGGNALLIARQDLTATGATVSAGGTLNLAVGRNITIANALDTDNRDVRSAEDHTWIRTITSDQTVVGSTISGVGGVNIVAGLSQPSGSLAILGSTVTSQNGNVALQAAKDITIASAGEEHDSTRDSVHISSGFLSSSKTTTHDVVNTNSQVASTVSGNQVSVVSGGDTTVSASNVAATSGLTMAAGGNINILAGTNTDNEEHDTSHSKSGLFASGLGFTIGSAKNSSTATISATTAAPSIVGASNGDVTIAANNNVQITGSQVVAGGLGNVSIAGSNVTINAAQNTSSETDTFKQSSSGLSVGLGGGIISAGQAVSNAVSSASRSSDSRVQVLQGIAGARGIYDAANSLQGTKEGISALAQGDVKGASGASGIGLSISIGGSTASQTSTSNSTTAVGSTVSGNNVVIAATGTGQNGALNVTGSTVTGNDTVALLGNTINLTAAQNTSQTTEKSSASGGAIGVTLGVGPGGSIGASVGVSAFGAKSNGNESSVTNTNTQVTAGNLVVLNSTGDTTIAGAEIRANQITANVGGNLTVQSLQDTDTQKSSSSSISGALSVGIGGGGSVSLSAQSSSGNGTYASVTSPSGLFAGNGGYQVTVSGNTSLVGGNITSSQQAANDNLNSLTTGSLTVQDLQNKAQYSASTVGGSIGAGTLPGSTGIMPGIPQSASASQSSTTASGVTQNANGNTVTVTDSAAQNATGKTPDQVVASLSASSQGLTTDNAQARANSLKANPNVAGIIANQQDLQNAAGAAAVAVARTIGDIATSKTAPYEIAADKADKAQKVLDDPKASPQAKAQAQQDLDSAKQVMADQQSTYDAWKEGGTTRAAVQAAGGALIAGLGGGNALGGAVGGGASQLLAPDIKALSNDLTSALVSGGESQETADKFVTNLLSNIAGSTGGGSGAAVAGAFDLSNRQLHPEERKLIHDNAKGFMETCGCTEKEAEQRLAQQAYRQVEYGAKGETDSDASDYLLQIAKSAPSPFTSNGELLFAATPLDFISPGVNASNKGNRAEQKLGINVVRNVSDAVKTQFWQPIANQVASEMGVDANAIMATCLLEGCQPVGGTGSIKGPFQFSSSTISEELNKAIKENPDLASQVTWYPSNPKSGTNATIAQMDPITSAIAAAQYIKDIANQLDPTGKSPPTVLDVRAGYQFGIASGKAIAGAKDDKLISDVIRSNFSSLSVAAFNKMIKANNLVGVTVGDWQQSVINRIGETAAATPVLSNAVNKK